MILTMSYAWGMDVLEKEEGNMKKGPWTFGEDMKLIAYVTVNGAGRWNSVAKAAGLKRSGKSCRFRWLNYLHPGLKRDRITPKEQRLIFDLQRQWGNRWSRIARSLPGRTDNEIKNYWRTHVKKMSRESIRACSCPPASRSPIEIKAVIENPLNSSRKSFKGHQTDGMKEGYAEFNVPTILNQVRCDSCELSGGNESSLTSQDKHQEFIKESSDMDTLSCTVAEAYATSTIHDSPSLTDSPINVFSDSEEFFWDYNSIDLWNLYGVPADNVNQIMNL